MSIIAEINDCLILVRVKACSNGMLAYALVLNLLRRRRWRLFFLEFYVVKRLIDFNSVFLFKLVGIFVL